MEQDIVASSTRISAEETTNKARVKEGVDTLYNHLLIKAGNVPPDPNDIADLMLYRVEELGGGLSDTDKIESHRTNMQTFLVNRVDYLKTLGPRGATAIRTLMASRIGRAYGDDGFTDATQTALSAASKLDLEANKTNRDILAREQSMMRSLNAEDDYAAQGKTPEEREARRKRYREARIDAGLNLPPVSLTRDQRLVIQSSGETANPSEPRAKTVIPAGDDVLDPDSGEVSAGPPPAPVVTAIAKGGGVSTTTFNNEGVPKTEIDRPENADVEANEFVQRVKGPNGQPQTIISDMGAKQVSKTIATSLGKAVDPDTGDVIGLEGKEIKFQNKMSRLMSEALIAGAVSPPHAYDIALAQVPEGERPETIDYKALGTSIANGQAPQDEYISSFAPGDATQENFERIGEDTKGMLDQMSLRHATGPISKFVDTIASVFGGFLDSADSPQVTKARFEYAVLVRNFIEIMSLNDRFPIAEQRMLMRMIPGPDVLNSPGQAAESMKGFRALLEDRIDDKLFELGTKLPVAEKNSIIGELRNFKRIQERLGRFNIDSLDGRKAVTYHEVFQKPAAAMVSMSSKERHQTWRDIGKDGLKRLRREDPAKFKALTGRDAKPPLRAREPDTTPAPTVTKSKAKLKAKAKKRPGKLGSPKSKAQQLAEDASTFAKKADAIDKENDKKRKLK